MESNDSFPLVSVGTPVYNGEEYLENAINSILSQTYHNFELIISDNCSTDSTETICKKFQQLDNRVFYYRNKKNMGFCWNQNHVIRLSKGKYFLLAHHDDIRAQNYVEQCVKVLENDSSIVLCYSTTQDINENEIHIQRSDPLKHYNSQNTIERLKEIIELNHICEPDFGLIRMAILKKTKLHGNYPDSDRVLLAELILYGPFLKIEETLFYRRDHDSQSTAAYPSRHSRYEFFDMSKAGKIVFPFWREFIEYFKAINRVKLNYYIRLNCYLSVILWAIKYKKLLWSDVKKAIKDLLRNDFTIKIKRILIDK